jgi:hypothetical protein
MIRAAAIVSFVALLVLTLYFPSAHPPGHFVEVLRAEHAAATDFRGADAAMHTLERAVRLHETAAATGPLPTSASAPRMPEAERAVAQEMARVNQRLFQNPYLRSVEALLMLASYRWVSLLEWLPWSAVFVGAALVDGALVRVTKSRMFGHHDPELFALWSCLLIVLVCAAALSCVVPVPLHPALLASVPPALGGLLGLAIASFHRRA